MWSEHQHNNEMNYGDCKMLTSTSAFSFFQNKVPFQHINADFLKAVFLVHLNNAVQRDIAAVD